MSSASIFPPTLQGKPPLPQMNEGERILALDAICTAVEGIPGIEHEVAALQARLDTLVEERWPNHEDFEKQQKESVDKFASCPALFGWDMPTEYDTFTGPAQFAVFHLLKNGQTFYYMDGNPQAEHERRYPEDMIQDVYVHLDGEQAPYWVACHWEAFYRWEQ